MLHLHCIKCCILFLFLLAIFVQPKRNIWMCKECVKTCELSFYVFFDRYIEVLENMLVSTKMLWLHIWLYDKKKPFRFVVLFSVDELKVCNPSRRRLFTMRHVKIFRTKFSLPQKDNELMNSYPRDVNVYSPTVRFVPPLLNHTLHTV